MKLLAGIIFMLLSGMAMAEQAAMPMQRGSYQKILGAHAGKPFIAAMWSVSCMHCGADLEIFAKLLKRYPQFRLVLISTDTPEQDAEIANRLNQYGLGKQAAKKMDGRLESWVFGDSYSERMRFEIDPQWYGELPRTYFIDAAGKARGVSGVLSESETEAWVKAQR